MKNTNIPASLQYILQKFEALPPQGPSFDLNLNKEFLGSSEVIRMFEQVFNTKMLVITVQTNQVKKGDDYLAFSGLTNVLNINDAHIKFEAKSHENELLVTLEIDLPAGWDFSTSFPDLPTYFSGKTAGDEKFIEPSRLNELSLGVCKLIFSNQACNHTKSNTSLVPGLNFVGEMYLMGLLYEVGLLLDDDGSISISGPINEYRKTKNYTEYTGIRLSGEVNTKVSKFGPVNVQKSKIFIKNPLNKFQTDHNVSLTQKPGVYLILESTLGGRPVEMVGKVDLTYGEKIVSVNGRFKDYKLSGFAGLSQTIGVEGIGNNIPADFPAPDGLNISEFGFSVDLDSLKILSLNLGIAYDISWDIIPDKLSLEQLGLSFFISSPFENKSRKINTTLSGCINVDKTSLVVFGTFPDYRLGGGLPEGESMPLGNLIEKYLPNSPELPELNIEKLLFNAELKEKRFNFSTIIKDALSIQVGATNFNLEAISFFLNYDKKGAGASGAFLAEMNIAEAEAVLSGELTNAFTLSGSLSNFDLKKFWNQVTNGEKLPDEIPDIIFENMNVTVTPKTGDFSIIGNTKIKWDHLPFEGSITTDVEFSLNVDKTKDMGKTHTAITASLSMQGQGPAGFTNDFVMKNFNFLFDYQTNVGWKLSGGMNVDIFDTNLYLEAGYETSQVGKQLKLQAIASPEVTLIDLEGVGEYRFKQFDLLVDRKDVGEGKKKNFFNLRVASTVKIDSLFEIGGYLSIYKTPEGADALLFNPNEGTAQFDVDFPSGDGAKMSASLFEIGFLKESAEAGWSFTVTTDIGFSGMPAVIDKILPSKLHARLLAGKNNARISAVRITDPIEIPLPNIGDKKLGKAVIQLTELGINIKPEVGLMIEAGIGLPQELNDALGGSQVFRVYEKDNILSLARVQFSILKSGIAIEMLSSPFAGANAVVVNGESWVDIDLGDYGAFSIKLPKFIYDGASQYFEAGSGIKIKRTLSLPLKLVKNLFEHVGMKEVASMFPDKLPLKGINLIDENNNLKTDELVDFLKQAGDMPGEIVSLIKGTADLIDRFPKAFKNYFRLEVPGTLEFKCGFSATGRLAVGLHAPKEPVRFLYPSIVQGYMPMPGFIGMEVRKLELGTIMSGTLYYSDIDAVMDQFDMFSLALSLMYPSNKDFPLPTSDELNRRIIMKNLFCVIPASEGLPIPIPVFYDQLGFEYLGVEGAGLQSHISFPKPKLDGPSAIAFFSELKKFTTDNKYLLDPSTPPGDLDLAFTLEDSYLTTPEYMGESQLGSDDLNAKISMWNCMAHMMNFFKTFSLNELITALPLEHRTGSAQQKFYFMNFDSDWLLTTPEEFKNGAFEKLKLTASDRDDFLDVLPVLAKAGTEQIKKNEEGLVAFVRGSADLSFMKLNAAFGMAASGSMGFNTGFKLNGNIANVIEMEMKGALLVNAPSIVTPYKIELENKNKTKETFEKQKCLSLNGTNSFIEIPASDSLKLSAYTVEMWIKPAKVSGWSSIFGLDSGENGCQRNYLLFINQDGYLYYRFADTKGGGDSGIPKTPDHSIVWDEWQHVAITNDGKTAKIFINGQEKSSGSVNGELVPVKHPVYMGVDPLTKNSKFFKSDYSEVRIWKRAKTAAEIQETMNKRLAGNENDLVSLYSFDRDMGAVAVDTCGKNIGKINEGTFIETNTLPIKVVSSTDKPKERQSLSLNGTNSYVEIPASDSLLINAYTIEMWIKPDKQTKEWSIIFGMDSGKNGPQRNYLLALNNDGFLHHRFKDTKGGGNSGIPDTKANSITWGEWQHVAITNDGKTAKTYINGKEMASGPVNGELVPLKHAVLMGVDPVSKNSMFFKGNYSEVRIWKRAKNSEEIQGSMNKRLVGNEKDMVSLYSFDRDMGAVAVDICGKNIGTINEGTFIDSTPLPVNERKSLSLNGNSSFVEIPASSSLLLNAYTIEMWIKPGKQTKEWSIIFGMDSGKNGPQRNYLLALNNDGFLHHRFKDTKGGGNSGIPDTKANSITRGEWQHVAITNDGKTAKTYINGKEMASGLVNGELVPLKHAVFMGVDPVSKNSMFFKGEYSEVRIWKRARTTAEIQEKMKEMLVGDEKDLVSLYRFDIDKGAVALDICGSNNGTVTDGTFIDSAKLPVKRISTNDQDNKQEQEQEHKLETIPQKETKAALQMLGHTHLTIAGHKALQGDLQLIDSKFWFKGVLNLFPADWPISVTGNVEGKFSNESFTLNGETQNKLFELTLAQSKVFISNDEVLLKGQWLGLNTQLQVSWQNNDPQVAGSVKFEASPTINFGSIYIKGIKISDNVRLSVNINAGLDVKISKNGFAAHVIAGFKILGKDFTLSFGTNTCPGSQWEVINWIKHKIIEDAEKYLGDLIGSPIKWFKGVATGTIEVGEEIGERIGDVFKNVFNVANNEGAKLLQDAGYAASEVAEVLKNSFSMGAKEVTGFMKYAGYTAYDVISAIKDSFELGGTEIGGLLKDAGYAIDDIAGSMSILFQLFSNSDITKLLKNIGFSGGEVADYLKNSCFAKFDDVVIAMKAAGYTAKEVANALKSSFEVGVKEVAQAMLTAGYEINEIAGVLKDAGFTAYEVADFMKNSFKLGTKKIAGALKYAGYTAHEVADIMKNKFSCTAIDVANVMKNCWGHSSDEVKNILTNAGYPEHEINNAVNKVFGWVTNIPFPW